MKEPMQKIVVSVTFTGMVEVEVPAAVPQERHEALARKVALARVLATTENPAAPEDDACGEYEEEFGLDEATAARNWDGCRTTGVSGAWALQTTDEEIAAVVERLGEKADKAGLQPEDLDEMVHELASSIASDTNNGGVDEQLRYLVEEMGAQQTERQIDELIEERRNKDE